MLRDIKQVSI